MSEISSRESNSVIDSRPGVPNAKARAFHAGLLLCAPGMGTDLEV